MRPASLWLADEFFLIAHRDYDGKPRLNSSALTLGLAGALLIELALHRRIRINPQQLELVVANPDPPPDATAHAVLDQLIAEPEIMSIATWLKFLGQTSTQRVADRLTRTGLVRPQLAGPPWKRSVLHPPLDANEAIVPAVRIQGIAARRQPLELSDALLTGLSAATGLDSFLVQDLDGESRQFLREVISQLPRPLMCLIAETKAAVGAAVLARRR
jgi:hypothetical protein